MTSPPSPHESTESSESRPVPRKRPHGNSRDALRCPVCGHKTHYDRRQEREKCWWCEHGWV